MKQAKGMYIGIGLVVVVVIIGLVALEGGSKKADTTKSPAATSSSDDSLSKTVETNAVSIQNYAFSPKVVKVKVGTTVTWTNQDAVGHNVVADNASSDAPSGSLINKGETFKFTFTKAGTYTYYCAPHPYMHGIVQVVD